MKNGTAFPLCRRRSLSFKTIAYFFHASLQGTECYPGAAVALQYVARAGLLVARDGEVIEF